MKVKNFALFAKQKIEQLVSATLLKQQNKKKCYNIKQDFTFIIKIKILITRNPKKKNKKTTQRNFYSYHKKRHYINRYDSKASKY